MTIRVAVWVTLGDGGSWGDRVATGVTIGGDSWDGSVTFGVPGPPGGCQVG